MEAIKFNLALVWNSGRQGTFNTSECWTIAIVVDLHKPSKLFIHLMADFWSMEKVDLLEINCKEEVKGDQISLVDPQLVVPS